jgi:hypothetical protein
MNYYFVTKLYNMKIDSTLSKGKKLDEKARISNGFKNFENVFGNRTFMEAFGWVEYSSFDNSVYIYEIGKLEDLRFQKELSRINQLNFFMRKVQMFLHCLWLVKDNSVNTELGFLQTYSKEPSSGTVTSNAMADSPTNSKGEYLDETFTTEELEKAITFYKMMALDEDKDTDASERLPTNNPLSKENGRVGRAFYFLSTARNESTLPLKAVHYCTLLECLFTSDSQEVTHKVSERFAHFLGNTAIERKRYYKLAKDIYKIRSKAVHGQPVKESSETMKTLLQEADSAIRLILSKCINKDKESLVFNLNNEEFENRFIDLILR